MVSYAELEEFFTGLVAAGQARGIPCAITSGMACVHFGVAATTRDCDVLCGPGHSAAFRALIARTRFRGLAANYRGNISPPLDARWMRGGWMAHFTWKTHLDETCLDVFGIAPRASSPWENELTGIYAHPNVVGEMKRTKREKDWPFSTSLGGRMLESGDVRGWLHLHDIEVMRRWAKAVRPPEAIVSLRPVLGMAPFKDSLKAKRILLAEQVFWGGLDDIRIRIYQGHLRLYTSSVRRAIHEAGGAATLQASHKIRVACALRHLPFAPLRDYGLDRMVGEAKRNTGGTMGNDVIPLLPDPSRNFFGL